MQGTLLPVAIAGIIVQSGGKPHAVIDLGDAEPLACQDGGDVDPCSVHADAAGGDPRDRHASDPTAPKRMDLAEREFADHGWEKKTPRSEAADRIAGTIATGRRAHSRRRSIGIPRQRQRAMEVRDQILKKMRSAEEFHAGRIR